MFVCRNLHLLGYLLIGVDYAFLFGVIAGLTNLIPYLGPYLGLAPALIYTFLIRRPKHYYVSLLS